MFDAYEMKLSRAKEGGCNSSRGAGLVTRYDEWTGGWRFKGMEYPSSVHNSDIYSEERTKAELRSIALR